MKNIGLMGAVLMSGAAFATDGIKLGGFADVGFNWSKLGTATKASKGFDVNSGALYLGKTMGMGEVMLDLAISSHNDVDTNDNNRLYSALAIGGENTQAWVSWKYDNGFSWKLGRFDNILGFEKNDSVHNFFSMSGDGIAKTHKTSTGLLLGYKASDSLNVSFLYADPRGLTGSNSISKADMGVKVESSSDAFNASVGFVMSAVDGASAADVATGDYNWTANVVAGSKMGQLTANLEATFANDKAAKKTATGFGGHFEYAVNEMVDAGAALEWHKLADVAGTSHMKFRVGPRFNMNKDFNVRLAYGMHKVSTTGSKADQTISLNAVHSF